MVYRVLIGIESDKTGKRFEPGETVTGRDFPARVIKNWLEIGVLEAIPESEKENDGDGEE